MKWEGVRFTKASYDDAIDAHVYALNEMTTARHFRPFTINLYKEDTMKIRMKTDHTMIAEVEPGEFGGEFAWFALDTRLGTRRYYSNAIWELVPKERWESVPVSVNGRSLMFDYQTESIFGTKGPDCIHICTLPENHRFVVDLCGRVEVQRKITS